MAKVLNGAGTTAPAGLILPTNELLYNDAADLLSGDMDTKLEEANAILDEKYPEKDSDGYRLADGERISFEILASSGQPGSDCLSAAAVPEDRDRSKIQGRRLYAGDNLALFRKL